MLDLHLICGGSLRITRHNRKCSLNEDSYREFVSISCRLKANINKGNLALNI